MMECGGFVQHYDTPHFHPRHPPSWKGPDNNSVGPAEPPPHRCWTLPLVLPQLVMARNNSLKQRKRNAFNADRTKIFEIYRLFEFRFHINFHQ